MNLRDLLPDFYANSPEMMALQDAFAMEITAAQAARDDCFLQLDVNTATWGLALWEMAYGITTDNKLPLELRRAQIKAKMGGAGTTRLEMIESVAQNYTDGKVIVEEIASEYKFKIKYMDVLDFRPDKKALIKTIDEIKPAHLAYEIMVAIAVLIYLNQEELSANKLSMSAPIKEHSAKFTWDDLDALGWDFEDLDAQSKTWGDIDALTPQSAAVNRTVFSFAANTNNLFDVMFIEN